MNNMIGKVICLFRGHLRGKAWIVNLSNNNKLFACPRCNTGWAKGKRPKKRWWHK